MNEALKILTKKLEKLQVARAVTGDSLKQFELDEYIEQTKAEIAGLEEQDKRDRIGGREDYQKWIKSNEALQPSLEAKPGSFWGTAIATICVGLLAFALTLGSDLERLSYDVTAVGFLYERPGPTNFAIIHVDDATFEHLGREPDGTLDRRHMTTMLERLNRDRARLVLLDFDYSSSNRVPTVDLDFAQAIRECSNVVLGARFEGRLLAGGAIERPVPPIAPLRQAAVRWGHLHFFSDPGQCIRRLAAQIPDFPTATWEAAVILDAPVTRATNAIGNERWLNYFGPSPSRTFNPLSLYEAINKSPAGFFRDRIVLIGSRSEAKAVGEGTDQFATAWTRFGEPLSSGVDIHATALANLLEGNWLRRVPYAGQVLLLVLTGSVMAWLARHHQSWWHLGGLVFTSLGILILTAITARGWHWWWHWSTPIPGQYLAASCFWIFWRLSRSRLWLSVRLRLAR